MPVDSICGPAQNSSRQGRAQVGGGEKSAFSHQLEEIDKMRRVLSDHVERPLALLLETGVLFALFGFALHHLYESFSHQRQSFGVEGGLPFPSAA